MAKTLEQYIAETNKAYDATRQALQNQINSIEGQLTTTKNNINAQYAQQQATLERNRDSAASSASMQAAGSGGSFGGSASLANRKYYEQAFIPAQTQLATNQAQDISQAEQTANQNRLSLQSQLAQLEDEARQYAYQRYDAAVAAEKEAALQRELASMAYKSYFNTGSSTPSNPYTFAEDSAGGLQFYNANTGNNVKYGTYYGGAGGAWNNAAILSNVGQMFGTNSNEYQRLSEILKYNSNKKLSNAAGRTQNYSYLSRQDSDLLNRLGLRLG